MAADVLNIWFSFLAGLFAPLGAVCVLPLYPGFLAYLAGKAGTKDARKNIIKLGFLVVLGVIVSLFLVGLIFTFFLQMSLTAAIGIISPIAFGILAVISILLIFNVDLGRFLPRKTAPIVQNPYLSSLLFGLFFGVIVLPCNPASLVVLFAVSTSTATFLLNLLNFLAFGIGMALPLLVLAIISAAKSQIVITFLTKWKNVINRLAGVVMLGISLYYLFFVFRIAG